MTEIKWKTISDGGFQFFGEMTGSISHEVKNSLAVINENAGLLQDLISLYQKGTPPDLDRLNRLGEQIIAQIKRSDTFVKRLNRFSHSVDIPTSSIDLAETLNFTIGLSKRIAANRGFTLNLESPPETIIISTHVFYFMNIIWLFLDFIMGKSTSGSELTVRCNNVPEGVAVCFTTSTESVERYDVASVPDRTKNLLEVLGGTIVADDKQGGMTLTFPEKISS